MLDGGGKAPEIQTIENQDTNMLEGERRSHKITVSLRSPYMVRQINVAQFLTAIKKVYQEWIMQNPNADKSGATMLMRLELLSLKDHAYVTASVIDVWSIILNDLERFRDPNSISSFFATTYPCSYTEVDPQGDDEVRLESFKGRLHHELQRVAHIKLPVLDLVVSTDQKYGKLPFDLKNMVMNYLKSESLEAKSDRFKSVKPTRIKMTWRDNENKEDCGAYVMRHMETFMGTLA
nr:hypothetical protein DM860_009690 [Ipomoea trifida]